MKRLIILTPLLWMAAGSISAASVEVNAGELESYIETLAKGSTNLKVKGTIDARDLAALRHLPKEITELNLQEARVVAYRGEVDAFPGREVFEANELPAELFYQTGLTTLWLPAGITRMGDALCASSSTLQEVGFAEGTTVLAPYALSDCSSLRIVHLPKSLQSVGRRALAGCTSLENLSLDGTQVISLPDAFLKDCVTLTDLTLPAALAELGSEVFSGTALTDLALPGLRHAADYALAGMPALQSVSISPDAAYGVGLLSGNPSLRSVTGSPAAIPDLFLANTPGADPSAILSATSETGRYSFANNAVQTLYLGSEINFIDEGCFTGASNLSAIDAKELEARVPEVAEGAFSRLDPSKIRVHVTDESFDSWKAHPVWSLFDLRTGDIAVAEIGQDSGIHIGVRGAELHVASQAGIARCEVYTEEGVRIALLRDCGQEARVDLGTVPGKVAIVSVESIGGGKRTAKTLIR